jgi:hypothetical protein
MSKDTPSGRPADGGPRRPRRELLAGAAGALAVIAAETVAKAAPAQAANGDPVLQGTDNGPTTSRTMIFTASNTEFASLCDQSSHGKGSVGVFGHGVNIGVYGEATSFFGAGVSGAGLGGNATGVAGFGSGNGTGVTGEGAGTGSGVFGQGGANGNDRNDSGAGVTGVGGGSGPGVSGQGGPDNGTGVHGTAFGSGTGVVGTGGANGGAGLVGQGGPNSVPNNGVGVVGAGGVGNGIGVWGMAQGTGAGVLGTGFHGPAVHGRAEFADAIGVLAENTAGGVAFKATGPARFSRSGVLTVQAGTSKVTKTGVALTAASLVLATLQQNRAGVFVQAAVPNVSGSSFTIHLNKTVSARTKVAWFVVN